MQGDGKGQEQASPESVISLASNKDLLHIQRLSPTAPLVYLPVVKLQIIICLLH